MRAFPGREGEERGQAEAIARSIEKCLDIRVPLVTLVIGEGGSGGALAIATASRVLMLEHSIYTVASPEASASILWRNSDKAKDAASAMKVTAQSLLELSVIDKILPEPVGGAHRERARMIEEAGDAIEQELRDLSGYDGQTLRRLRQEKFMAIGRNGFA